MGIDHRTCLDCDSKACVPACAAPGLPGILSLAESRPVLNIPAEEAARGGCIECLACEVACRRLGRQALTICLGFPEFDRALAELEERKQEIVWRRKG